MASFLGGTYPDATSALWQMFLDDATGGDRDLQAFLQRAAGYSLTGDTSEERLFFPYGPPHYDLELGISGMSGEWDDAAKHAWTGGAIDASLHLGPYFEAKGEYVRAQYGSDIGNEFDLGRSGRGGWRRCWNGSRRYRNGHRNWSRQRGGRHG